MKRFSFWWIFLFLAIIAAIFWQQNGDKSFSIVKNIFQKDSIPSEVLPADSAIETENTPPPVFPYFFAQLNEKWQLDSQQIGNKTFVLVKRKRETADWETVHRIENGENGASVEDFDGDKLLDIVVNDKRGGNELWLFSEKDKNFKKVGNFHQLSTVAFHLLYETVYMDSLNKSFYSRLVHLHNFKAENLAELRTKTDSLGNITELTIYKGTDKNAELIQTVDGSVLNGYYKNGHFDTDDFLKIFWKNNAKTFLKE